MRGWPLTGRPRQCRRHAQARFRAAVIRRVTVRLEADIARKLGGHRVAMAAYVVEMALREPQFGAGGER